MDIDLIFKIAAVGIIVSILNQVLVRSGREEQATMTSLAGLVVVLMIVVQRIAELFDLVKTLFRFYAMEIYVKIAACSVVCALLCAVLKPHEGALALAVSVLAAAGAAVAALGLLSPVLEFFEKLLSFTGLSSAVFSPLLKTVAIALLGQIAGAFCQDAGQGALGKMVELCGTVLCLCTALPLATMLLELLQELGGGG